MQLFCSVRDQCISKYARGGEMEEKDEGAFLARREKATALADLMSTILHQSADAAFKCPA